MANDPNTKAAESSEKARHLADGDEPGRPEPKSRQDWAERGAEGGKPGRCLPPSPGGSSQGSGDRTPSDNPAQGAQADVPTGARPQPKPGEG